MSRTQQSRFNLKEFFDELSPVLSGASELLSLGKLLAANRERLGAALAQGSISEARSIVKQLCTDHPAVAGVVNYVMTKDVDSAINAIGMYDAPLAETLRQNQTNFVRLQQEWPNAATSNLRPCGCTGDDWSDCRKVGTNYGLCPCPCHKS